MILLSYREGDAKAWFAAGAAHQADLMGSELRELVAEEGDDLDHGGVASGDRPAIDGGELDRAHGSAHHVFARQPGERRDLETVGGCQGGEHRRQPLVHLAGAQLRDGGGRGLDAGIGRQCPSGRRPGFVLRRLAGRRVFST